ncbi:MAG: uroporphyrinogen-III C-methyltransferase [Lentisphaeraceae bacterium]|nr:uroporphyrinogen-III C-methyltransferase [Lentisphaeraceae bacterium]
MKYLQISAHQSLDSAATQELQKRCSDLCLEAINIDGDNTSNFDQLVQQLLGSNADLFFCKSELIPDMPKHDIDFFVIRELSTAVVFKTGNTILEKVRSFYAPPVSFIGGGPGNHEWLTMEAHIILNQCEIVFYDALVNPLIVAALDSQVECYYVGKRGDSQSFDQNTINELIADRAKRGLKVGRLKGGDSGIFGRITEEIDLLLEFNMSFHVVPGISAMQSISSCTGIFLTQRGVSDRVTLTTARSAGGAVNKLQLCKSSTLIVYMGILSADKICDQLIDDGYDPQLPAAILLNLTRKGQRVIHTNLGELPNCIKENNLRPPGLLVFGNVTDRELQRLPAPSPLLGRKVLISGNDADALKTSIEVRRWGGTPIMLTSSTLELEGEKLIPEYDDIIFFSNKDVNEFKNSFPHHKITTESQIVGISPDITNCVARNFDHEALTASDNIDAVSVLRQKLLELITK